MKPCQHENRVTGGTPPCTMCADCGVLLSMTDPVIAAIVDSAPGDYAMQLKIAAALGSAR